MFTKLLNSKVFFLNFFLMLFSVKDFAQVTITSSSNCGVSGSSATYNASGANFTNVSNMQWCVTGGTILQAYGTGITGTGSCRTGTNVYQLVVQWGSAGTGLLTLNTTVGNASFSVTIAAALNGGTISNPSQTIGYYNAPGVINCPLATGGHCTPTYQYQWQISTDNSTWSDIGGATTQNLTYSTLLIQTSYFRRKVTVTNNATIGYSTTATVTVNPPFTNVVVSPAAQTLFTNETPTPLSLNAPATGGSCGGAYNYFWQTSTDGGVTFTDNGITGYVAYTPNISVAGTKYYRMKVVCGTQTAFSNAVVVNSYDHLATPAISPSTLTIGYNTVPTFSVGNATGGQCAGVYSYLWEKSTDNQNFTSVATTANYSPTALTTTTYFRRTVTCGAESVSATVQVNVNNEVIPGYLAPGNLLIPSGTSPGIISATPAKGGNCANTYTYTWQKSADGTTYTDITGTNNALTYTSPALTVNTYYRIKVTCGIDIAYTKPILITIQSVAYAYNFIQSRQLTKPGITTVTAADALTLLADVKQATQYFDGLGRPIQTVTKQGSLITDPLNPQSSTVAVDLVKASVYDEFNRETFNYLPFATTATDATKNTGNFKLNPFEQQAAFYNDTYASNPLKGQTESYFFSQSVLEFSPLNRPEKAMAQGKSWMGSARGVGVGYFTNTATDAVRIWNVTNSASVDVFGTYASPGNYTAGTLYKNITTYENGKQVIEFKDKEGNVILKKVQLTATVDDGTGKNHAGWLCTYYIYDNLNNLRCVIQPRGVELLNVDTWTVATNLTDATILAEQCFRYEYDGRNRMIMKQVPGAGPQYMVYDKRDRVVAISTATSRAGTYTGYCFWNFTLYDDLNRPVATGEMHSCSTLPAMISYVNGLNNANVTFNTQPGVAMSVTAYNPVVGNTICTVCSNWNVNSVTHYDDYAGLNAGLSDFLTTWNTNFSATDNVNSPYPQMPQKATNTKGLATWTATRNLSNDVFLYGVSYYDEKARVIQTQSTNITNKVDVATTQYAWDGKPLITVLKEEINSTPINRTTVVTRLSYDDLNRLVKTEKKLSNTLVNAETMSAYTTVSTNEYDAIGQLSNKTVGSKKDPATGAYYASRLALAKVKNEYNIRGWLLSINKDYITASSNSDQYFGMQLGYDVDGILGTFANKQFNGNISGTIWKSEGDQQKRKYDFSYDAVNRLMKADFNQYVSGTGAAAVFNKSAGVDFSMQVGDGITATNAYDANGNIKGMKQWGLKLTSSSVIDEFTYNYMNTEKSNKLLAVTESTAIGTTDNKLGDFTDKNRTLDDYTYDANGNLITDKNKTIGSITYNHLNLPKVITITGKGTITYTYDATGNKLQKQTIESPTAANGNKTITTTTKYIAGFVYESKTTVPANTPNDDYTDVLQFMPQEEGRIRFVKTNAKLEFDYFLKDHLGNTRAVLTEEVTQNTYPAATLENVTFNGGTAISVENSYYNITPANVVAQTVATGIPAYQNNNGVTNNNPYSNTGANSASLYKLDATTNTVTNKTGLGIALKVMAGDKINLFAKSYHKKPAGNYVSAINPLSVLDIMNLFAGTSLAVTKGITGSAITSQAGFPTSIGSLLNNPPAQNSTTPRAGINWVILDEQFKWVAGGFDMVNADAAGTGAFKSHTVTNIAIPKNGYIYIYCSNESQYQVFFDNLQVIHTPGPIMEETHYYPFGLTMAGVSYKAAMKLENKIKFTGQLIDDDFGWNCYQMKWRTMDPQLGRFIQVDPLASRYVHNSVYAYAENDVIRSIDIEGLEKFIVLNNMRNGNITSTTVFRVTQGGNLQNQHAMKFDHTNNSRADYSNSNKLVINNDNGKIVDIKSSNDNLTSREKRIASSNLNVEKNRGSYSIDAYDKSKIDIQPTYNDPSNSSTIITSNQQYDRALLVNTTGNTFNVTSNSFTNFTAAQDVLNGDLKLNSVTVTFANEEQAKASFDQVSENLKTVFGSDITINQNVDSKYIQDSRNATGQDKGISLAISIKASPND